MMIASVPEPRIPAPGMKLTPGTAYEFITEPAAGHTVAHPMSMPADLKTIVDRFKRAPRDLRVQALLQYAGKVPELPPELAGDRDAMEQVHECQTPFFLATRVDEDGAVHLFFDAPAESPTVRGFAGILREGLEGADWRSVLDVPSDFYAEMGLGEVVSPMRLRGMNAILNRLKRQIREHVGADGSAAASV